MQQMNVRQCGYSITSSARASASAGCSNRRRLRARLLLD
jgi:hypothetical protein